MKDIFKVMGTYFALGFGIFTGVGAGLKVCEILLDKKQNEETEKAKNINFVKESE